MFRRQSLKIMGLVIGGLIVSQAPALANAGVPMAFVIMPYAALLLLPVILIEALTAKWWLRLTWQRSFLLSGYCNLVSTLLGIPVTWVVLVVLQLSMGGGSARGLESFSDYIYAVTLQSPWLIPYERELDWMIPMAAVLLTLIFGVMSVLVEALAGYRLAKRWPERERAERSLLRLFLWSAPSNLISYGPTLVSLALYAHAMLLLRF